MVEVAMGDSDGWQESPKSMLWDHHVLFQAAINYYLVALLGMATSDENPLTKVRERLATGLGLSVLSEDVSLPNLPASHHFNIVNMRNVS